MEEKPAVFAASRPKGKARILKYAAFSIFIIGSAFVSKELWHTSLCRRLGDLQAQRAALENKACRLGYAVSPLSDVNVVIRRAGDELGLVFREETADTIWVKDADLRSPKKYRAGLIDFNLSRQPR